MIFKIISLVSEKKDEIVSPSFQHAGYKQKNLPAIFLTE